MSAPHRIAVIGGSGFIGTHLVRALLGAGHAVRIVDKTMGAAFPQHTTLADVRDRAALEQALQGCDVIVNLAAEHRDDVEPASLYFDVNVTGAQHVVYAAAALGIARIVFLSTVAVYGLDRPDADESAPLAPFNAYGRSKAQAEAVYRAWADAASDRALLLVRPTVVFGEGNRGNVFTLVEQLRRGRFVMVGRGDNRKSVAYVGNLVAFLRARLDAAPGTQLFIYADTPHHTAQQLVARIRAALPAPRARLLRLPRTLALACAAALELVAHVRGRKTAFTRARVRKFCADTSVATHALAASGFVAPVPLDDALARTVAQVLRDA